MKKQNHSVFAGFYLTVAIFVLFADIMGLRWVYYMTKPVIMIMVFFYFKSSTVSYEKTVKRNLMLIAFLTSAVGDLLLMFSFRDDMFFISGLIAFLITHIVYSVAFVREITTTDVPFKQHWMQLAFSTFLVVYGAEFFILNRSSFGEMTIPVAIYCLAITVMGVSATMREFPLSKKSYYKVLTGAVLFIASDSLLATNKFIIEFNYADPMILSTYFLAQYLIATGVIDGYNAEEQRRIVANGS